METYPDDLAEVERDLREIKAGLRQAGVPSRLLDAIATRALRSQRRQTGQFQSNRASRWRLEPADPQYGTEIDCKIILIRLYGMMMEFRNAPLLSEETKSLLTRYLGKEPEAGAYRDPLTRESLDYAQMKAQVEDPTHGVSDFHLGHDNPQTTPKHSAENISWRSSRSNLLQGDLTLPQARAKFVELIARYFELGEVTIHPDNP